MAETGFAEFEVISRGDPKRLHAAQEDGEAPGQNCLAPEVSQGKWFLDTLLQSPQLVVLVQKNDIDIDFKNKYIYLLFATCEQNYNACMQVLLFFFKLHSVFFSKNTRARARAVLVVRFSNLLMIREALT